MPKRRSVYNRIVWAIAEQLGVTYTQARVAYKPMKQWLMEHDETLSAAAVERHPRVVPRVFAQGQAAHALKVEVKQSETELHRIQQTKGVVSVAAAPTREVEEWEVTVKYTIGKKGKHHGETVDISLRLIGKAGASFTAAQVRAAAWYALKHGPGALTEFTLEAIDWYNERRSGKVEEYHYGADEAVLNNARGIFYTVGLGGLRVALVE